MIVPYRIGAELPDLTLRWEDGDGDLIDFSTGWTFTLWAAAAATTTPVLVTKTTGITGYGPDLDPNVRIAFASGELAPLATVGNYDVQIRARRTADSKDRDFPGEITIQVLSTLG